MSNAIKKLLDHIDKSPIGWHNGQIMINRRIADGEIVSWLQELRRLSDILGNETAAGVRKED